MARLKPAKEVELDSKHFNLRVVLLALAIVIAVAAFGYGINSVISKEDGWLTVDAEADTVNCSMDFTLEYYFGGAGVSATAEYKQISALYTTAVEDGYRLFYREGELQNVNSQPNTVVTVDPVLYDALSLVQTSGNRCLYLAPVYEEYDRIFLCENEDEAQRYDPGQNQEISDYVNQIAAFANDPNMIDLELLGDNTVRLRISDAYLAFAGENEITEFLDFGWMKNAFIADFIADTLAENGYTLGYVSSYDGFTRNLDSSGLRYSFNLFDRLENTVYRPAVMDYTGPMSIVYLRNYALSDVDQWHYFSFSNGRIVTALVDPSDGMSKSATDNLVAYSQSAGCAEILLNVAGVYLANELDETALNELAAQGIASIWFEDTVLLHTQNSVVLNATEDAESAGYQIP